MATILTNGTLNIVLPSPDFENSEKVEFDRINRKSRGGDLLVFRDPEWTHVETLNLRFSYLCQSLAKNFLKFLYDTLGQIIYMTDWEGRTWQGIIITPPGDVSQPHREGFSAAFQFQGQETT